MSPSQFHRLSLARMTTSSVGLRASSTIVRPAILDRIFVTVSFSLCRACADSFQASHPYRRVWRGRWIYERLCCHLDPSFEVPPPAATGRTLGRAPRCAFQSRKILRNAMYYIFGNAKLSSMIELALCKQPCLRNTLVQQRFQLSHGKGRSLSM